MNLNLKEEIVLKPAKPKSCRE